jgi:N,N'-diacetyllegionaminate synthase
MIRRHVVTINAISKGEIIRSDNLVLKRTSSNNALTNLDDVVGKLAKSGIESNSSIEL